MKTKSIFEKQRSVQSAIKRQGIAALSLACAALAALALYAPPQSGRAQSGVFRLHILANSDSPADQATKLRVRDAVLAHERAFDAKSAAEARAALMADGAGLMAAVEGALAQSEANYGAQLKVGAYLFPSRQYAGVRYPAGEYAALRIVLGEGAGQNWWCVMFPPLCITAEAAGEAKENAGIRWKSWIGEILQGKA